MVFCMAVRGEYANPRVYVCTYRIQLSACALSTRATDPKLADNLQILILEVNNPTYIFLAICYHSF